MKKKWNWHEQSNKKTEKRTQHPYFIYESIQRIPDILAQCSGIPGVSYEMENFIHGAIQALTKNIGVIGLAPGGPLQERMLRTMMAVKTIGAKTMILAPEQTSDLPYADIKVLFSNQIPELLSPIVYMVPLWQTAYQFALMGRGGHPDRLKMDSPEFKQAFVYLMKNDKWVR